MAQYKPGGSFPLVNVTNGSPTVVIQNNNAVGTVLPGHTFYVAGVNTGRYEVSTVVYSAPNTNVTLTTNYGGTNATGATGVFHSDFTSNVGLPLVYDNDLEFPALNRRQMELIDARFVAPPLFQGAASIINTGVNGAYQDALIAYYTSAVTEKNVIQTSVSSTASQSGFLLAVSNGGGSSAVTNALRVNRDAVRVLTSALVVNGTTNNGTDALQVTGSAYVSSNLGIGVTPASNIRLKLKSQNGVSTAGIHLIGPTVSTGVYLGFSTSADDDNFQIWNERNGYLAIATNNLERVRLTSTGNVLIGTTTDNGTDKLQVRGSDAVTSVGGISVLTLVGGDNNNDFCNLRFSTALYGSIVTLGAKATTTGAPLTSVGELHVGVQNAASTNTVAVFKGNGNVLIGTTTDDGTNKLQVNGNISVLGGGIVFPATQVPSANANTLDDYEEGTFTPTFAATTPGTSSWSYTTQVGRYTKIGRQVVVAFAVTATVTKGTMAGDMVIGGLPFTVENTGTDMFGGALGFSVNFATPPAALLGRNNSTSMYIMKTTATAMTSGDLVDATAYTVRGSLTYNV